MASSQCRFHDGSVEAVMREDRMLKAYEILELYLELLAVGRWLHVSVAYARCCAACLPLAGASTARRVHLLV